MLFLFLFIEVIILNKTIETIKKAEQDGDTIVISAKEQISKIKEELSEEIKKAQNSYRDQIKSLRDKTLQEEKDSIIRQLTLMDKNFNDEKDSMRKLFLAKKEDLLEFLVGKVMNSNGDSCY